MDDSHPQVRAPEPTTDTSVVVHIFSSFQGPSSGFTFNASEVIPDLIPIARVALAHINKEASHAALQAFLHNCGSVLPTGHILSVRTLSTILVGCIQSGKYDTASSVSDQMLPAYRVLYSKQPLPLALHLAQSAKLKSYLGDLRAAESEAKEVISLLSFLPASFSDVRDVMYDIIAQIQSEGARC